MKRHFHEREYPYYYGYDFKAQDDTIPDTWQVRMGVRAVKKLRRNGATTETGSLIMPLDSDADSAPPPAEVPEDEPRDTPDGERPGEKARRIVTGLLSPDR